MIEDVTPVHSGAGVKLSISLSSGENSEERELTISADKYFSLGKPVAGTELDEAFYEVLEDEAKLYDAVNRGLYLLSFGDNNQFQLVRKLRERGHSKEHAVQAAQYLASRGYINEDEQILERILYLANKKLYGKRRIISELYSKGYSKELISEAFCVCEDDIDFEQNKQQLLLQKFGSSKPKPNDRAEYNKIMGFLFRYGY